VFSLGKTLFETVSVGHCPFDIAKSEDIFYKLIIDEKYDEFWSSFQESFPNIEEFKDELF
jgi:hypothetical protein